jgi:multidrug efflux pump subunit AcrA (membrane-fusion protein)
MPNNINTNFHSEAVTEILSNKPSFLVRYGITFFFGVLCLVGIVCWFVQYPDIIIAPAKLTSINAPKPIITNISGKLIKLFVKENDSVSQNQIVGYVEATANHNEVQDLAITVQTVLQLLNNNNSELIQQQLLKPYNNLGELQSQYQIFATAFLNYKNYLRTGFYVSKKAMLTTDLNKYRKLNTILNEQKNLQQQDLSLTTQNYEANKSLNTDKVIADVEMRNETSKLINKKISIPQITSSIVTNEMQQNEKLKEIAELENAIAQQKIIFLQATNTFKSQIDDWVKKYLLIAPINGTISFATFLQENQQLQANQTICFVNTKSSSYYAEINIPQANFGKIAEGQKVLLKLPSYPFQEYGAVTGKIDFISHIPTDSGYVAKVSLTNGLQTNYNKNVQYRDGLTASAEIVTKDMRLLQRFYYTIAKQVKN